jgi:type I restriction enzyme R subunit
LRYLCARESGNATELKDNEPKRVTLYKLVAAYLRAYANLANEMGDAGYSEVEAGEIKGEVDHYEKVRQEVKLASGDYVDLKMFEPAMRHLLDTYIRAEESERLSQFDDLTLVQLIVERGESALDSLPENLRSNSEAMAETIENNIRRLIIDEMAVNPKYYEKMSQLLDALIKQRKQEAMNYKAYLARVVELSKRVSQPETQSSYPTSINNGALRALYDNLEDADDAVMEVREPQAHYGSGPPLDDRAARALALDHAIRAVKKADWRGNRFKEREVRNAIVSELGESDAVDKIFEIVKNQREY